MATGEQTPYEGEIKDRLHVMQKLAQRFKSNIRLWASWPVDDGQGCVDYEVEVIHVVEFKTEAIVFHLDEGKFTAPARISATSRIAPAKDHILVEWPSGQKAIAYLSDLYKKWHYV